MFYKNSVLYYVSIILMFCQSTVTRFGPKVGQIGPKWDKSGKFSDQIQYMLARCAKMY